MFGRVTSLHFSCFLPSLGGIVPITAEVATDEHGDLVPGAIYQQGNGEEVSKEDSERAVDASMDACAALQDTLAMDPAAKALCAVLDAERALHSAAQSAKTALRVAGVHSVGWGLDKHETPDNGSKDTPGLRAMEEYAAHLAETMVPARMLKAAEEAEERWTADRAEEAAENAAHERAEYQADMLAARYE